MNVAEIENEIKKLPADKVNELVTWLANYQAELWEKQIADDLNAGRLESLLDEVEAEIEAGTARPL